AVGGELARRLGWTLVDTDAWIERAAEKTITRIFAEDGEAAFRAWETKALEALAVPTGQAVFSTGGGIVLAERNWPRLRALGPVVCLTAGVETILGRVGQAVDRPLLAGEPAQVRVRVETLLAQRQGAYARAQWACATDGKSPAVIAEQIVQHLALKPKEA
ncbi:MAG: shikimate kinase, partial [Candidatus Firestonebacteria bacterium]|nr:shikimate kinase [Candidatus Firestonebacteria bacterium]